ncbi:MAG TPA: lysophospholipid acyltransferase family protein [Baekduia sp.]|nr:lysophospholipid acyltransferase family protein [Baekduia sp.]
MEREIYHARSRGEGVNRPVYWALWYGVQPALLAYFRLRRIGRDNIPRTGAAIIASNHRSFLDALAIAITARRPLYYVAKKEMFASRTLAYIVSSLGGFPIDRGNSDEDAMTTARTILARGDAILIFPEGTRVRPGPLGEPKRGVGRLALETGAPVIPVAVAGTERARRGIFVLPRKVRVRVGAPIAFETVSEATPELAAAATARIWPLVELQWEWLGGTPSARPPALAPGSSEPVFVANPRLAEDELKARERNVIRPGQEHR